MRILHAGVRIVICTESRLYERELHSFYSLFFTWAVEGASYGTNKRCSVQFPVLV